MKICLGWWCWQASRWIDTSAAYTFSCGLTKRCWWAGLGQASRPNSQHTVCIQHSGAAKQDRCSPWGSPELCESQRLTRFWQQRVFKRGSAIEQISSHPRHISENHTGKMNQVGHLQICRCDQVKSTFKGEQVDIQKQALERYGKNPMLSPYPPSPLSTSPNEIKETRTVWINHVFGTISVLHRTTGPYTPPPPPFPRGFPQICFCVEQCHMWSNRSCRLPVAVPLIVMARKYNDPNVAHRHAVLCVLDDLLWLSNSYISV